MIELEGTDGGAVSRALAAERRRVGAGATGMVLTLIVLTEPEHAADALASASGAAREHPMRILVCVARGGRGAGRIDAQLGVGGSLGPGEVAVLHLSGGVSGHPGSVVVPLLLPDTPVVAWWPARAPQVPATDEIGEHASRRITDACSGRTLTALRHRAAWYRPGDTDLAWARTTLWRTLLTSLLDEPVAPLRAAEIRAPSSSPAAALLAAWLHRRLGIPVVLRRGPGPHVAAVRLDTRAGPITVRRRSDARADVVRPGRPDVVVALPDRGTADLLGQELRIMEPDPVYGEALESLADVLPTTTKETP
jgi:glucose-6-phosphate dehydrogenase assembly protein OpcA